MKKKSLNFIIKHGTYPFDIMVSLGESIDELEKRLKFTNISESEVKEEMDLMRGCKTTQGRTIMFSTNQTVLWLRYMPSTPIDFSHLQHEIFHSVDFMLSKIGIKLSRDSDEAYAYQIQYVTEKIYFEIFKHTLKGKGKKK